MKKRVLSVVLVICMVLSVMPVFAAEFTDVLETVGYYDAVKTLSEKNVIKGYPDGTFKPENDVIRAEFTTMLVRAMGDEAKAFEMGADGLPFNDCVDPDIDYAISHINLAYSNGIVIGVGEDRFEPSRNVTYEEAVKMIVCGLGLEEEALKKGAYPDGYLTLADEKGLLEGVSGTKGVPAKRWQIAQALYNGYFKPEEIPEDTKTTTLTGAPTAVTEDSVTIAGKVYPLSEAYKLSRTNKTEIKKGVSMVFTINSKGEILSAIAKPSSGGGGGGGGSSSSSKPTAKIQGIVLEAEDGTITIKVTKGDSKLSQYVVGNEYVIDAGSVNTANMLGRVIDLTFTDLNSDPTLKSAALASGRRSLTIDIKDIYSIDNLYDLLKVNYYTDKDNDITRVVFVANNLVYANGKKTDMTLENIKGHRLLDRLQGTIEFYAADDTASVVDYDTVFLHTYEYVVVDSYDAATNKIIPHDFTQYFYDIDCTNLTLVDESGKTISPASLKSMDILAVDLFGSELMEGDTIRCVLLPNRTVTGTVIELGYDYYTSVLLEDNTEYWLDPNWYPSGSMPIGDEVTIYLGYGNQIIYHINKILQAPYGILVSADQGDGINPPRIKMITDTGDVVTKNLASRVRIFNSEGYKISVDSLDLTEGLAFGMIGCTFKYQTDSSDYISTLIFSIPSERPYGTYAKVSYNRDAYFAGRLVTNIENAPNAEMRQGNPNLRVNGTTYFLNQDTKILHLNRTDKPLSELTYDDLGVYKSADVLTDWDLSDALVSVFDCNMYGEPTLIVIDGEIKGAILPAREKSVANVIKSKYIQDGNTVLTLSSRSRAEEIIKLPESQFNLLAKASLIVPNKISDSEYGSATVFTTIENLTPVATQAMKSFVSAGGKVNHWFGNVTAYADGQLTIDDQLSGKSVTKAVLPTEQAAICNIGTGGVLVALDTMNKLTFDLASGKPVDSDVKNYCVYIAQTDGKLTDLVVYSVPYPVSTEIKYGIIDYAEEGDGLNPSRIRMIDSNGQPKAYTLTSMVEVMTYNDGVYTAASVSDSELCNSLIDLPVVCKYRMNVDGYIEMLYTCQPGDFPATQYDTVPFSNQAYDMGRLVNNKNYDMVEFINIKGDIKITDGETEHLLTQDTIILNSVLGYDGRISKWDVMHGTDALQEKTMYAEKISVYDSDSQGRVRFVYVTNGKYGDIAYNQHVSLVNSVRSSQNEQGENVEKLNVYKTLESALSTYTLTPDCDYNTYYSVGSAVMPWAYNLNGDITELRVFTDVDFYEGMVHTTQDLHAAAYHGDFRMEYLYGKIVRKSGSTVFIKNELDAGSEDSFNISNTLPVLVCDLTLPQSNAVKISSIADVELARNTETGEPEDDMIGEYKVLIRKYQGGVKDVVLYILPAPRDW